MINKKLFKLLGKNKKYLIFTILLMVISLLLNICFTFGIAYIVTLFEKPVEVGKLIKPLIDNKEAILNTFLFLLASLFFKYSISILIGDCKDKLTKTLKRDLRNKVFLKTERLGFDITNKFSMSTITQMSLEGIEQLDMYFTIFIPQLFYSMIAPLILFGTTVYFNYKVSLVLILIVPIIPAIIMSFAKKAKKIVNKYMDKYYHLGDTFYDSISGLSELKVFKADKRYADMMKNSASDFRKITMKVLTIQLVSLTLMDMIAFGGAGLGIALALLDGASKTLMVSQAFLLILLAIEFFIPLRVLGSAFHISLNGANAGKKIIDFLALEENTWGDKKFNNGLIKLEDVSFSYDMTKPILENISMSFSKNALTAIIGNSGCGKSTILKLLLGQYRPTQGSITIDNILLSNIDKNFFFKNISFVSSDTFIFNDTIRNNFKIASPNITDEQIYTLLEKVKLLDFVTEDKEGLDKIILEDSKNISGGQKQRLALAISLSTNKMIYLFDEATSNIDVESEQIITDIIYKLKETKTIIFITHRLFNVINADKIYFLDEQQIKEVGTHKELLLKNGFYATLFKEQRRLENYGK